MAPVTPSGAQGGLRFLARPLPLGLCRSFCTDVQTLPAPDGLRCKHQVGSPGHDRTFPPVCEPIHLFRMHLENTLDDVSDGVDRVGAASAGTCQLGRTDVRRQNSVCSYVSCAFDLVWIHTNSSNPAALVGPACQAGAEVHSPGC